MAVVATGFFDGVHIGHRMVIDTLLDAAVSRGEESVAVTFWPHPRIVLGQDAGKLRLLTTIDEKRSMMEEMGVDRVEILPFTPEFSRLSTSEYIRSVLKDKLGATAMVLGYDNRMGHDSGSPSGIAGMAKSIGLDVVEAGKVCSLGIDVSSTRIREAIGNGDVALAAGLLGYHYQLTVELSADGACSLKGDQNLKAIPAPGNYLVLARSGKVESRAVLSVGAGYGLSIADGAVTSPSGELSVSFLGHA